VARSEIDVAISIPMSSMRFDNSDGGWAPIRRLYFRDRSDSVSPEDHFSVVVRNTSHRTLAFFADGNSWGDPTIRFELTYPDGSKRLIKQTGLVYSANGPGQVILAPNELWVREIYYNRASWSFLRPAEDKNNRVVKIQASLTQVPEARPLTPPLWTGTARSRPVEVTFWKL
jgi:hypothetical protein